MDRQIVYPGSIPLDTDLLNTERNIMVALGFLAQATLGTSTVVDGLACTPQTVPNLTFNVGPGSIISLQTVDANAFGSLPADNADALVKMGVNIGSTLFTVTAPTTTGQSINYLIQASFQESDATAVVLPYYNSANPAVPYSGPSNSGAAQNTQRLQRVNLQLKSGTPAATGSQVTPTPDAGFVGLWVVTVAFAQTTVVSGNIALYPGAPFIGGGSTVPGRLLNVQTFTAPGTYTPTAGTKSIVVDVLGGGGAGGGTPVTSSSQFAAGGGGQAGGYAQSRITSGFSSVAVTIGAGGTASTGNGGTGGTSSFGALVTSPGGNGGSVGVPSGGSIGTAGGTGAAAPSGGSIVNLQGQSGFAGNVSATGAYCWAGQGGSSPYGAGGLAAGDNAVVAVGTGYGAGGSGVGVSPSAAAQLSGAGSSGLVIVREYS